MQQYIKPRNVRKFAWFTLVELIVVITILVILGMIAFLNLGGYSASARDSSRVSDMTNISKGLELALVRNGTVPVPEAGSITVSASGVVIGYQGYAGSNVLAFIKMSEAKDPLDKKYYTYSTNVAYTKYEMLGLMEDPGTLASADVPSGDIPFVDRAYAGYETRTPATRGSSLGVLLGNTGASLNVPVQENYNAGSFTGVDLVKTTTLSGYTMVFSKNDTTASVVTSGTGAYTGSLFTFAYNKRDDLIANKALAGNDPSLVGYWDMETLSGTLLKDLSGHGNDGTCYNSGTVVSCGGWSGWPQFVEGTGKSGKAMRFDGVDDWVELANTPSLNINWNQMSIFLVVKPVIDSSTGSYEILGRHSGPADAQWTMVITNNLLTTYLSTISSTGSYIWNPSQIATPLTNNSETKTFSYVYNGNKAVLTNFPNSKQETYFSWNIVSQTGKTKIWKYILTWNLEIYKWTIDEVRIYNRALSDSEIQALYQATR